MTEVLDPAAKVYEGVWRDWSKDKIQGLTWTLNQDNANLLSNLLTLFIALVAGQAWTIIRFTLHQVRRGKPDDPDEVKLQQRVVLRNAASDLHTLKLMLKVAWRSRTRLKNSMSYPLAIAALALIHYAVFILAQTFLNTLVSASPVVLAVSPDCGPDWSSSFLETMGYDVTFNISSLGTVDYSQKHTSKRQHNLQLSLEYAQQCYASNPRFVTTSPACNTMKSSHLDFDIDHSAEPCPFGSGMCHERSQNIHFTSQKVDTHYDLGINSPLADRLYYRRQTTCAVLNNSYVSENDTGQSNATAYAKYGYSLLQGTDWTYSSSNLTSLYTEFTPQDISPYRLNAQFAYVNTSHTVAWTGFSPIDPLVQANKDADLTLLFLTYSGRYFKPVDDPWFSAHNVHHVDTPSPLARTQYSRDSIISTVGCLERHQFCKPGPSEYCTPFLSWGQVQDFEGFSANLRPLQKVIFGRLLQAVDDSSAAMVLSFLGMTSTPLLAIDQCATQRTTMSLPLPDNQWMLEMRYWYSIAMAQLQRGVVQWATGQITEDPLNQLRRPNTTAEKWFCDNLMIPSEEYQSFSVLGVVLILAIGCLIIVVACTLERIAAFVRRCRGIDAHRASWAGQDVLNLFTSEKSRQMPLPPPPPSKDVKAVDRLGVSGGLSISQVCTESRPALPPGYRSFDSRCPTLQDEISSGNGQPPPQPNTCSMAPQSWMDQPLCDEKELPRTPVTPRQVFETWRHERKSKRHGFHV
jgi:hypothetical protein